MSQNLGDSITLTTTITPSNATNKTVTWSCSNSNVVLINNNSSTCIVIGITAGNSMITAKTSYGNKTAICTITVNSSSSSVCSGCYYNINIAPSIKFRKCERKYWRLKYYR